MRRLLLCVLLVAASPAWAKSSCNPPAEVSAVQVRQMQIEMMVATMRCDSSAYDFRHHYAAFMDRLNPLMTDNAKNLKSLVRRQHKGDVDRYITAMANDAQNISQQDPEFCGMAVQVLEQVSTLTAKDIPAIAAQAVPSPYQVAACPAKPAKPRG